MQSDLNGHTDNAILLPTHRPHLWKPRNRLILFVGITSTRFLWRYYRHHRRHADLEGSPSLSAEKIMYISCRATCVPDAVQRSSPVRISALDLWNDPRVDANFSGHSAANAVETAIVSGELNLPLLIVLHKTRYDPSERCSSVVFSKKKSLCFGPNVYAFIRNLACS